MKPFKKARYNVIISKPVVYIVALMVTNNPRLIKLL